MNENNYVNYSTPGEPLPPAPAQPPVPPEPPAPVTWRDIAAPFLALALSVLFWQTFSFGTVAAGYGPGLGVTVFVLAYFAVAALMLGKRLRPRVGGILLAAAAVILSVCCALYAHPGIMILNCFIILVTAAMATFSFSDQLTRCGFTLPALPEAFVLSVRALFTRIDRPFRLLRRGKGNGRAVWRIVLTVLGSLVVLAVVLALLATADMVFGSFFTGIGKWFERQEPFEVIWRIMRTVGLAVFICSGLFFIREGRRPAAETVERPARERHTLPFLLPAVLLDIVYVLFCAVQLRYLFGGAEAAAMAGGWAEYARTGFFQLVAVACIDLALCVIGARWERFSAKGGLVLRIADGLLLVLTAVILLSAARRMQLYIGAFGMSLLRLLTLWGMLVIAVGILAAAWKLIRPDFVFWRVFSGFALGTWCLLCLMNPAGLAANYNVDAYLDGRLPEVDVWYLENLTPDAAPALQRLVDESDAYDGEAGDTLLRLTKELHGDLPWSVWKLSFRDLERAG